jgi:homocitrate synthase NifV
MRAIHERDNVMNRKILDSMSSGNRKLQQPLLLDTTLRDGEQSPGIYFTHEEKKLIAKKLDELGVDIIEAGIPCMGKEEKSILRQLTNLNLRAEIMSWNRCTIEDIVASIESGVRSVHVSLCTSPQMLTYKIHKTPSWVFKQMEKVIGFGVKEGLTISFGAEDSSRTDLNFLTSVFLHAQNLGVKRIRFADTLGILTPEKTACLIGVLSKKLDIPIDFHGHNDFGLANANALCAWKAGAKVISCSLLGLGERAGNTPLEEFVGSAYFIEGFFRDFDLIGLRRLCRIVSRNTKRPIDSHKPIFGKNVYMHESGIHVDGLIKAPATYEFFPPEMVGGKRRIVVGKHSGRSAIKYIASLRHKRITDRQAVKFISQLHAQMARKKGINAENSFKTFIKQVKTNDKKIVRRN